METPEYSWFLILSLKSPTNWAISAIPPQPFCLWPFALSLCVTATKTAASQCQWPFPHCASPYPGLSQASRRSGTARTSQGTKGPAACRALALHGRKWGLLNILDTCTPSFYSAVIPNGRLLGETGTHWKLTIYLFMCVITHDSPE